MKHHAMHDACKMTPRSDKARRNTSRPMIQISLWVWTQLFKFEWGKTQNTQHKNNIQQKCIVKSRPVCFSLSAPSSPFFPRLHPVHVDLLSVARLTSLPAPLTSTFMHLLQLVNHLNLLQLSKLGASHSNSWNFKWFLRRTEQTYDEIWSKVLQLMYNQYLDPQIQATTLK